MARMSLLLLGMARAADGLLPCANVTNISACGDRCNPLTASQIKPRTHEVTAYHSCGYGGAEGDEWKRFDYTKLTTIAQFCPAAPWGMICAAHEHGVRVVNWMVGTDRIETCAGLDVLNATAVDQYVTTTVNDTMNLGMDGILFDIEGSGGCGHHVALSDAIIKAADAMHAANPVSHVLYSSGTRLPNISSFNASTGVDYRRLAPHFDQFQPMEYCSLDNGTAACAPTSWVNESINSYTAAGIAVHGRVMPIWPWIGPAYLGCKGDDCSMEKDPASWDGFPGCDADANAAGAPPPPGTPPSPGWQLCPALGFGQLMSMLPNSTAGLQWSDKWQQNYFNVPPGIYPNKRTNASGVSATIWIDTAKSLAPKYKWAIDKCGGFGVWTADTAGVEAGKDSGGAAGKAMWDAIPSPYAGAM